jgi:ATP-binding cassette subfamily B protein RaxB
VWVVLYMNKKQLQSLQSRLHFSFKKQLPLVLQSEAAECGLACLVMICRYHQYDIDLFSLRQKYGISSQGATLALLIKLASQLGLESRPLALDLDELHLLRRPCILHWNMNHFVVLVAIRRGKIIIHDPAFGQRILSKAEFSQHFSGVALELWPTKNFSPSKQRQRITFWNLLNNIEGLTGFLVKLLALSLLFESINLLIPIGTQLVLDHVVLAQDQHLLTLICLGLFCFILFRTLIGLFRSWITLLSDTLINVQWKNGFFVHLLRLPINYFEKRSPGDIQSRFSSLDAVRSTLTTGLVGGVIDSIMTIGLLVMMFVYGGWLIWVVLGFTLIFLVLRLITFAAYRQASEEKLVKEAKANSHFMETLYGISTLKALGLSQQRAKNWLNLNIDSTNAQIKVTRLEMFYGGLNSFIATLDQIIILWLGASMVIEQQISLGMFVAFNAYRGQFSERAANLIGLILQLRMLSLHNERLTDIALSEAEPEMEPRQIVARQQAATFRVKNLRYSYDAFSLPILQNFNLAVAAGESVAIVGPSGVGKSTLMKLMAGLLSPDQGQLFINDLDIHQIGLNNYRACIACVLQNDKLFAGSIADNIAGFDLDKDQPRLIACAEACNIYSEIQHMPMGFETLVSELGTSLSGGQIQRLLIARALYRQPAILFMDEATSHLDVDNEAKINAYIKSLKITRIFIAHRQSTIDSADRIVSIAAQDP